MAAKRGHLSLIGWERLEVSFPKNMFMCLTRKAMEQTLFLHLTAERSDGTMVHADYHSGAFFNSPDGRKDVIIVGNDGGISVR